MIAYADASFGTEAVTHAESVLSRTDGWLTSHLPACAQKVRKYMQQLRDDLDIRNGLLVDPSSAEYLDPGTVFPDLSTEHNTTEIAVGRTTQDIVEGAVVLMLVVSECSCHA